MDRTDPASTGLEWAGELGLSADEIAKLNPCVPGEFTLSDAYYLNTASPRIVYAGTTEGTLPLVAGRWYLIPEGIVGRHPSIRSDAVHVARAARLAR
jgi:hypothetical protein